MTLPPPLPALAQAPQSLILLVDDDGAVRESLRRVLVGEGYAVREASGGKTALEVLQTVQPSLVITDLCMRLITGWDLIQHLHVRYPELPLFVISAYGVEMLREQRDAVVGYFEKPLDIEMLLVAIRRQIGGGGPPLAG